MEKMVRELLAQGYQLLVYRSCFGMSFCVQSSDGRTRFATGSKRSLRRFIASEDVLQASYKEAGVPASPFMGKVYRNHLGEHFVRYEVGYGTRNSLGLTEVLYKNLKLS